MAVATFHELAEVDGLRRLKRDDRPGGRSWAVAGPEGALQLSVYGGFDESLDVLAGDVVGWDFGVHFPAGSELGEVEMDDCELLEAGRCNFAVSGPAGWATKELALHYMHEESTSFDDAVWWTLAELYDSRFRR